MSYGRDEECDCRCDGPANVGTAGSHVHVPQEEVVDGDIPFAAELEPVEGIPPVGVESAVRETGDFGEGAEDVFEDYEEDEQEGDHEGEEEGADGFGEDEGGV